MQGRALPGTWQAELGNRLDAYAAAYLSPNPVRTAAARASVMVEARRLLVPAAEVLRPHAAVARPAASDKKSRARFTELDS